MSKGTITVPFYMSKKSQSGPIAKQELQELNEYSIQKQFKLCEVKGIEHKNKPLIHRGLFASYIYRLSKILHILDLSRFSYFIYFSSSIDS